MFLLPPPTLELFSPFHSSFFLLCYHFLSIHLSLFFSESYLQMSAGLNYFWDVCVFSQGGVFSLKWSISLRLVTLEPQLHSQQVHVCTHTHTHTLLCQTELVSCFDACASLLRVFCVLVLFMPAALFIEESTYVCLCFCIHFYFNVCLGVWITFSMILCSPKDL